MNTTDVIYNNQIKSFDNLYKLAKNQFINYEKIEGIDNWNDYDFSIDCCEDQNKFKDMIQIRFIEELTEASCSLKEKEEEHFWEEIGDSLNFFLSSYLILNVDLKKLPNPEKLLNKEKVKKQRPSFKFFSLEAYSIIEKVGYLCNLLKNRPWAQSNYLVSIVDFEERLNDLWISFWSFLGKLKITKEDVFEIFYKKYKVNEYRMKTGY